MLKTTRSLILLIWDFLGSVISVFPEFFWKGICWPRLSRRFWECFEKYLEFLPFPWLFPAIPPPHRPSATAPVLILGEWHSLHDLLRSLLELILELYLRSHFRDEFPTISVHLVENRIHLRRIHYLRGAGSPEPKPKMVTGNEEFFGEMSSPDRSCRNRNFAAVIANYFTRVRRRESMFPVESEISVSVWPKNR